MSSPGIKMSSPGIKWIKWKQWKKFSGPMCFGTGGYDLPPAHGEDLNSHVDRGDVIYHGPHWDRVSYLTAMVESGGRFGAVVMFDGTGATTGIHQAIAVYPKNLKAQGPLWKLLWRLNDVIPLPYYPLWSYIEHMGWQLSPRGLIWSATGRPVEGRHIRKAMTPIDGVVPKSGVNFRQAKSWLIGLHEVFSMPAGHRVQVLHGIETFIHHAETWNASAGHTLEDLIYDGVAEDKDPFSSCPELDLAMAHFWCNWVNGPSVANKIIRRCITAIKKNPVVGAMRLVSLLGNAKYGRWDDDIGRGEGRKYKSRYQRFREEAMKLYPRELFLPGAIMADDLPG